jgi:hypothetical protein
MLKPIIRYDRIYIDKFKNRMLGVVRIGRNLEGRCLRRIMVPLGYTLIGTEEK